MTFLEPSSVDEQCGQDDVVADCSGASSFETHRSHSAARSDSTHTAQADFQLDNFWPHVPALRSYLRRRVPPADVEDVLQDIFLNIIRRSATKPVARPKGYLFQAAQAALVDRHRRQTTRRLSSHCELREADDPVDECSPLRILLAKDDIRAAEDILRGLPERTQEIIVAVRLEGTSLKSLARRYNISTSAIEKHVTKASKALASVRSGELVAQHS